jgi:hypothetical protein
MVALHYFDQGLVTPLDNPLPDEKSHSKLYHSITPEQWPAFEYIVATHIWIREAPDLLEKETTSKTKGGGWAPKKDSLLDQLVKEALDKDAPKDSLWRYIYTQKSDLKPVITFGLIYIQWKQNFRCQKKWKSKDGGNSKEDGDSKYDVKSKSKSMLNPEEDVKRWPTAAKQFLVEMLMGIEFPSNIAEGIKWIMGKLKRKKGS